MNVIEQLQEIQQAQSQLDELKSSLNFDDLIAEIHRLNEENAQLKNGKSNKKVESRPTDNENHKLKREIKQLKARVDELCADKNSLIKRHHDLNEVTTNYERKLDLIDLTLQFCEIDDNCPPHRFPSTMEKIRKIVDKNKIEDHKYLKYREDALVIIEKIKQLTARRQAIKQQDTRDDEDDPLKPMSRSRYVTMQSRVKGVDSDGEVNENGMRTVQLTSKRVWKDESDGEDHDDYDEEEEPFIEL